jgi:hypothetical protein
MVEPTVHSPLAPANVGFFRQFVCRVGVLDQPESMIHDVVALSSFYFSP